MSIRRLWAGRAYGTNTGNLFAELDGDDTALSGTLRLNDTVSGLTVYRVQGRFDKNRIELTGEPAHEINGVILGRLTANATLNTRGELVGEWRTDIGTAGTFVLFPHNNSQMIVAQDTMPDQLHTARHYFGAIEIEREQINSIAEEIQRDFRIGKVVVTFVAGTEQSRFFEDFKALNITVKRADFIKIFVQEPEPGGTNRVVSIEFGPQMNLVMTQSSDETKALGALEKLKRDLHRYERSYATNIKRFGFGINQLLIVWAIIYIPSLQSLRDRAIFMAGVLLLILSVNQLHKRYLPLAAIYLTKKPIGLLTRIGPSVASWLIAVIATVAAALLSAYLEKSLGLPSG